MRTIHKFAQYTALILVSALPVSFDALADAEEKPVSGKVPAEKKSESIDKQKIIAEKIKGLIDEAKGALTATNEALASLNKNDPKAAKILLEDVLTKLDILLVEHPSMTLVPADVGVDMVDYQGDAKSLQKTVEQADKLLDSGRLQSARRILANLVSELRITTVSIPLGTYPEAIKEAIVQIDAQNINEAKALLEEVLGTLVAETEITPLPVLRAEDYLTKASEIEHKEDMGKSDSRSKVLEYTNAAKDELKVAELLGYGDKAEFHLLYTVIDDIKDEMHTERSAAAWERIKKALAGLKSKITGSSH